MPPEPCQHLTAAEGYFELEMYEEALEELELAERTPANHIEVTARTLHIHIAQKHWDDALPFGEALCDLDPEDPEHFIHYAYVLRELDRVEEARETLLAGPEALRLTGLFHYNLACYEALLGETSEAHESLERAFALQPALRKTALTDTDLASLRDCS